MGTPTEERPRRVPSARWWALVLVGLPVVLALLGSVALVRVGAVTSLGATAGVLLTLVAGTRLLRRELERRRMPPARTAAWTLVGVVLACAVALGLFVVAFVAAWGVACSGGC
ncbi:MAG: hypothetical protein JWO90_2743 [Solirubrobacterales bacterium]|jgi:hypothetical protein|nr:hypothetical protein [Solirubrobacterales bacterium]